MKAKDIFTLVTNWEKISPHDISDKRFISKIYIIYEEVQIIRRHPPHFLNGQLWNRYFTKEDIPVAN